MPAIPQRSFAGGELDPALHGRHDIAKHAVSAKTVRNAIVARSGKVMNRPGTSFVGEVKDSTKTVRLIEFIFNSSQTYVLEFGDEYLRVIRSGAQVTETAQNITGISNASPGVLTYDGADNYAAGDHVYISGVVGAIANNINGRTLRVGTVTAGSNTFQLLNLDGTSFNTTSLGSYTSGGTIAEVFTLTTPYAEEHLADIRFSQSADVITLTHPSYAVRELSRTGHASWNLSEVTFEPDILSPGAQQTDDEPVGLGYTEAYVVCAVSADGEESLFDFAGLDPARSDHAASGGAPTTITWNEPLGDVEAVEYNIYKSMRFDAPYGLLNITTDTEYEDDGSIQPDLDIPPPRDMAPFGVTDSHPTCVAGYQQRRVFGNTNDKPENVWGTRVGHFRSFVRNSPLQDDDALQFSMSGRQVNSVQHLLDLGTLLIFTSGGEHAALGDVNGVLTPTSPNPTQYSGNGSGSLRPMVAGSSVIYVQAEGAIIRDLRGAIDKTNPDGDDLTAFAYHLLEGREIVDWTYQKTPHSIVWIVLDSGQLLGMTYIREQQILAFHRHDFNGDVENVCSVPEGNEHALYLVVRRTIDGETKRYIERMNSRYFTDVQDAIFMDCALTLDGRNTSGSHTMTLSNGNIWTEEETLTLTSSASFFAATDVGNVIILNVVDEDDLVTDYIRFEIEAYSSATVVTGKADKVVPLELRLTATVEWAKAVDEITGLWHLEGEAVSVFADGNVIASPNNEAYDEITVENGAITLSDPQAVVHVGLPYISDLETLDVDIPEGGTIAAEMKMVNHVTLRVEKTRGLFVGTEEPEDDDPIGRLTEPKYEDEVDMGVPVPLHTGILKVAIRPEWNEHGRVFIRQVDPLPMTILSVAPDIETGG